jgi:hypothetical protein
MTVIIGDPLCAPVERRRPSRAEIDDGVDTVTALPVLAKRRISLIKRDRRRARRSCHPAVPRGEALAARDVAGARAAFEEVVRLVRTSRRRCCSWGCRDLAGEHDAAAALPSRARPAPNNAVA